MNNIMLMLHEYYYTQQFFVLFINIVLFVAFLFGSLNLGMHSARHWAILFFYFLPKLLPSCSFAPLDPLVHRAIALNKFFVILSVLLTTCDYL